MGIIFKLAARDFLRRRSMLGFAFLSIAAVCCLVVWFIAGIDMASFSPDTLKECYGKFDVSLTPAQGGDFAPESAEKLEKALAELEKEGLITWRAQGRMASADLRHEGDEASLAPTGMGERRMPYVFAIRANVSPFELDDGRWFAAPLECVIGGEDAESLLTASAGKKTGKPVNVGDRIRVRKTDGEFVSLTVSGKLNRDSVPERNPAGRGGAGGPGGNSTFAFGFGIGLGGGPMGGGKTPPPGARRDAEKTLPRTGNGEARPRRGNPPEGMRGRPARGNPPETVKGQGVRRDGADTPPRGRFGRRTIGATSPVIYVSYADAEKIFGSGAKINFIFIQLADVVKARAGLDREDVFYHALSEKLGVKNMKELGIQTGDKRPPKAAPGEQTQMSPDAVIGQAWATIGIVLIASVFIIFTTLSMGVSEKIRHLAMLRTVGFTRAKVAAYILLEGLALGLLGWIAGLVSGWALLTFTLYFQTGVMPSVILTWPCVAFAFGCAVAGALIASIVPAWRATRVSPAESMVRKTHNLTPKQLFLAGAAGLVLLALIPVIVFCPPVGRETKLLLFKTVGVTLMGLGFLLFFPWTIIVTEKLLGPAVARLLGFHPRFLANIFSGNQWRTFGVTVAMSIGLALFTAIHIWSGSMLTMFTVPDTIPDTLVRFQEGVLSPELAEKLEKMPWVRPGRFMRLSVAQPKLDAAMAEKLRTAGAMAGNAVLFGVDAEKAYRADEPLLRLKFVEGSREEAFQAFRKTGARVCVIPETLSVNGGLHVGGKLKLAKSARRTVGSMTGDAAPAEYAEYTVVGVVDFPWVWLSKCAGVRVSEGRTAAVAFVPYEAPLTDFGAPEHEFFWFDTLAGTSYQTLSDEVKKLAADSRAEHSGKALRNVKSFSGGTLWDSGINRNFVQVSTSESLNNSLNSRAFGVIDAMTRMPLIILILSTIAVVNTMVVSVRARRWEMGVLRACGVTRWGLIRMILAEALLIGMCACVMSFCLGLFYAWLATRLTGLAPMFGIIAPPLFIDWARLSAGFILAMGVCLIAGIGPAFSAGLEETSRLLHRKD